MKLKEILFNTIFGGIFVSLSVITGKMGWLYWEDQAYSRLGPEYASKSFQTVEEGQPKRFEDMVNREMMRDSQRRRFWLGVPQDWKDKDIGESGGDGGD